MSIRESESEVTRLSKPELTAFHQWFEEFMADSWDHQIEADIHAGKLNYVEQQAEAQFDAGRRTSL